MGIKGVAAYAAAAAAVALAVGCSSPAQPTQSTAPNPAPASSAAFVTNCEKGRVDQSASEGYRWRVQVSCNIVEVAGVGGDLNSADFSVIVGFGVPAQETVSLEKDELAKQLGTTHWNGRQLRAFVFTFYVKGASAGDAGGYVPIDALVLAFQDDNNNRLLNFVGLPICFLPSVSLTPRCS